MNFEIFNICKTVSVNFALFISGHRYYFPIKAIFLKIKLLNSIVNGTNINTRKVSCLINIS